MTILLIGIPAICYFVSFIYGRIHPFSWFFPLLVMLLFVPTLWIFYNESAWVYIGVYGILSIMGNAIGSLLWKKKHRSTDLGM